MVRLYDVVNKFKKENMTQVIEETGRIRVVCDMDGKDYGAVSLGGIKTEVTKDLLRDGRTMRLGVDDTAITYIFKKEISETHSFDMRFPLNIDGKEMLIEMMLAIDYSVNVVFPMREKAGIVQLCKKEAMKTPIIKSVRNELEHLFPRALFGVHSVVDIVNAVDLNRIMYDEKQEKLTELMDEYLKEYGLSITIKSIDYKWKPSYINEIQKIKEDAQLQEELEKQLELIKNL